MPTTTAPLCSCGELAAHRVARRVTVDGFDVVLWSDGWVTSRLGFQVAKLPVEHARAAFEWVGGLDWRELRPFFLAWKRARRRARATDGSATRAAFEALPEPAVAPPDVAPPRAPTPVERVLQAYGRPAYRELEKSHGRRVFTLVH